MNNHSKRKMSSSITGAVSQQTPEETLASTLRENVRLLREHIGRVPEGDEYYYRSDVSPAFKVRVLVTLDFVLDRCLFVCRGVVVQEKMKEIGQRLLNLMQLFIDDERKFEQLNKSKRRWCFVRIS